MRAVVLRDALYRRFSDRNFELIHIKKSAGDSEREFDLR